MGVFDDIASFEKWNLQGLAWNMIKWYNYDSVDIKTESRPAVASRVWITVDIKKDGHWTVVQGQNNDIVKRRLIEFLYQHHPAKT